MTDTQIEFILCLMICLTIYKKKNRMSAQSLIRTSSLISVRNATLLVELRSGRVGSMTIDNQKDLDKLLERFV